MARDGLSERECAEILGELRRQCCSVNDELLVWLASTFALKAPVDFDPNDLALLLNQPERKVIRQNTFSQDITPTDALEALLSEVGAEDARRKMVTCCCLSRVQAASSPTCSLLVCFSRGEEMSDPRSKAEQSKAKDLRQGIVEHSERSRNSHPTKRSRPWKIMSNLPPLLKLKGSSVFCAHRSPTRDAAEAWVRKETRNGYAKAEDYWIEGPDDRNSEESAK